MTGFRLNDDAPFFLRQHTGASTVSTERDYNSEPMDLARDYESEAEDELMMIRRNEVIFLAALLVVFVSFVVLVVTGSLPGDGL